MNDRICRVDLSQDDDIDVMVSVSSLSSNEIQQDAPRLILPQGEKTLVGYSLGKYETWGTRRNASFVSLITSAFIFFIGNRHKSLCSFTITPSGGSVPRKLRHRAPTGRIVGGIEAAKGKFPSIVALYWGTLNGDKPVCGGTLISPNVIVTAAHCAFSLTMVETNRQYIGDDVGVNEYKIKWEDKRIHPEYDTTTRDNDIALIKLPSPELHATPAALHQAGPVPNSLTAAGWGLLETDGSQPNVLMEVDLQPENDVSCKARYGTSFNPLTMLCAWGKGKDTCQGDSGGPLFATGKSLLVGITSWGYACASSEYPGVYVRVATYDKWINKVVCEDLSPGDCVDGKLMSSITTTDLSKEPTHQPSASPTEPRTLPPSTKPFEMPTFTPTMIPTEKPTVQPIASQPEMPQMVNAPTFTVSIIQPTSNDWNDRGVDDDWPAAQNSPSTNSDPSSDVSPLNCTERAFFGVGFEVQTCEWVKQRKDRRCPIYSKYCPQTCDVDGCN